jgi:hypothetical protein
MLPSIHLDHLWYIQRIDAGKGIGSNKHNTTIGVNLFLRIS